MNDSVKEHLPYLILKKAMQILSLIPRPTLGRLAVPLGRIWYGIDHYHRRIAFENMQIAFGREKRPGEIRRMVRANFLQLTRVMLEIPSLLKLNEKNVDSYVEFVGLKYLTEALARKKGILILTAHIGNWELMALAVTAKFKIPVNVLVRPLDYKPFDRVLTEIRSRTGNRVMSKDHSAAAVSQLMLDNKIVGILLDQNSSWYEGVYVPFFGKTACTNKGLAMFALRYGATVLPVSNIRQKDGRYRIIFEKPLDLVRSGNISDDIVENTAAYNKTIEKFIRLAPEGWLWVHRRWRIKSIPDRARKKIAGMFDEPI